ncbi:MAG: hypothetical protein WDW36_002431 [Sanguina aurantia]
MEIIGCLKIPGSMLALGACDRVKRISKAHPQDIANSPIIKELLEILSENSDSALAASAMAALATVSLHPTGRQRISMEGAIPILVKLIARGEVAKLNTDRAVGLLMNLAADHANRRAIRDIGGIEALVGLMKLCQADEMMEHCMGALHNAMLTDNKAKGRAVDAGVLGPILQVITLKGVPPDGLVLVRAKLLLSELMRLPNITTALEETAELLGVQL